MPNDTPDLSNGGKAAWALAARLVPIIVAAFLAGAGAIQFIASAKAAMVDTLQSDVAQLKSDVRLIMYRLDIRPEQKR